MSQLRTIFAISVVTLVILENLVLSVELYSDKYDYIDANEIVTNDRLRNQYYKCFMDEAPCVTPDAKFFKNNFPEVLVTSCRKCTQKQIKMFDTLVTWYTENRPDEWNRIVARFLEIAKQKNIQA